MMDRRNILCAMAVAPVAVVAPALPALAAADPCDEYLAAFRRVNAGTVGEDEYLATYDRIVEWQPPSPYDFVRKYEALYIDGGHPNYEITRTILRQASRLLSPSRP